MDIRRLGKTGYDIGSIGFGAWAIGGSWGQVDDATSLSALHAAADVGVTFYDTADVYGDGHSERLIGRFLRERPSERLIVATKAGRRVPQLVVNYTPDALAGWIDRSRQNLGVERLDLVQLHCPPTDVYYHPEVFAALDELVAAGAIAAYGVSVERVEEALKAVEYPGVASIQIVFNIVRQRPLEHLFAAAKRHDVGILARVPLASGLLTGKLSTSTAFEETDHRSFNRHGESFDVGETFAGLDYETGLALVEELRPLVPADVSMAQLALRWILMSDAVTAAIPGARSPEQARSNAAAATVAPLSPATMDRIRELYEQYAKPLVHQRW
jgi:aryl-alcohol dehydrogenase-like predicted oxidoreductase